MEPTEKTRLSAKREFYRLWYEYLRTAHELIAFDRLTFEKKKSIRLQLQKAIKKTQKLYAKWDLEKGLKFDTWWKTHSHLFEEKYVVRELKHGELPSDPDAIVLEIPLRFSASELAKHTRQIIKTASQSRNVTTKSKKRSSAKFTLTAGAEPKKDALREMLTVYRNIQIPNMRGKLIPQQTKELIGVELLDAVNTFYGGRKFKKSVPMTLLMTKDKNRLGRLDHDVNANALRSLRRYIQKTEKILLNVARGEFPGTY